MIAPPLGIALWLSGSLLTASIALGVVGMPGIS
jgi:hypothetical protein